MDSSVLGSIIVALISAITTIITSGVLRNESRIHSARQSILQLILEDKVSVMQGKLPENRENILHELDEYDKVHGNSYVHCKVDEYKKWYESVEQQFNKGK